MTAQVPFFNDFFEKDPHFNVVEKFTIELATRSKIFHFSTSI